MSVYHFLQHALIIYVFAYAVSAIVDLWKRPRYEHIIWYFVCFPFVGTLWYIEKGGIKVYAWLIPVYPFLLILLVLREIVSNFIYIFSWLSFVCYALSFEMVKALYLGKYTGALFYLQTIRLKTKHTVSVEEYNAITGAMTLKSADAKRTQKLLTAHTLRQQEFESLVSNAIDKQYSGDILQKYLQNNMSIYDQSVVVATRKNKQLAKKIHSAGGADQSTSEQYLFDKNTGYNAFGRHRNGKYNQKFDMMGNEGLGYAS